MAQIKLKDAAGATLGELELADAIFAAPVRADLVHAAVVAQLAAKRTGTHSTLDRGQVSGGGRKPYRQKGTGRARQGTNRAPQFAGGGVVFGPHPRSYAIKVNKKEVKLAMRSALSAKKADGELILVEDFAFEKPSTKQAVKSLDALGVTGRCTLVLADDDVNSYLSFRNIPTVRIISARESNTYDFVDNKKLIITKSALSYIEEVLN